MNKFDILVSNGPNVKPVFRKIKKDFSCKTNFLAKPVIYLQIGGVILISFKPLSKNIFNLS